MDATSEAMCPTVTPVASTTYHFRLPARSLPLGKYVDIVNYLCFQRGKRERLGYRTPLKVVKLEQLTDKSKRLFGCIAEEPSVFFAGSSFKACLAALFHHCA